MQIDRPAFFVNRPRLPCASQRGVAAETRLPIEAVERWDPEAAKAVRVVRSRRSDVGLRPYGDIGHGAY